LLKKLPSVLKKKRRLRRKHKKYLRFFSSLKSKAIKKKGSRFSVLCSTLNATKRRKKQIYGLYNLFENTKIEKSARSLFGIIASSKKRYPPFPLKRPPRFLPKPEYLFFKYRQWKRKKYLYFTSRRRRRSSVFCRLNYRKSRFFAYFRRYTVATVHSGFFLKFQRQYSRLRYLKSKVRLFNLLPDNRRTKYTYKKFFSSSQRRYLHFCFDITRNGKKTLRLSVTVTRSQKILYTCFKKFMGTRHSRRRISYYRHEKNRTRRFKKIKFFLHFIRYYKQQPTILIPFFKLKFMELPYEEFQLARFNRLLSIQRVVKPVQFFFFTSRITENPKTGERDYFIFT
jgi:hypothetical protein